MDLGRLRSTEWIAGALSAALIGAMFVDWYESREATTALNAWEAFDATDVAMAVAAGMGLMLFVLTATQQTAALPIAWAALTALAAPIASVFVVVRVFNVPDVEGVALVRSLGPALGLPLILGLSLAVWFGLRNERPGHGAFGRAARQRVVEVETLQAPPAAER